MGGWPAETGGEGDSHPKPGRGRKSVPGPQRLGLAEVLSREAARPRLGVDGGQERAAPHRAKPRPVSCGPGPDGGAQPGAGAGWLSAEVLSWVCAETLTLAPEGSVGLEEPEEDAHGSSETQSPAGLGCGGPEGRCLGAAGSWARHEDPSCCLERPACHRLLAGMAREVGQFALWGTGLLLPSAGTPTSQDRDPGRS